MPLDSGSIAVAYLLTLMDMLIEYVQVFNRAPQSTFGTFARLDRIFHRLMTHTKVSMTEQTRLKALIARARSAIYSRYHALQEYEADCSKVFELSIETLGDEVSVWTRDSILSYRPAFLS